MAHTAHKNDAMMEEIHEDSTIVGAKAAKVARFINESTAAGKKIVFFTGAGISTSAGILDYRGPDGVWTCAAEKRPTKKSVNMTSAIPTATHMAIATLVQRGMARVISQNVDGLHRKSGIPADAIAELHGNSNQEECNRCGKRYMRDYQVHGYKDHYTGRNCSAAGCTGKLRDTIINFGENLSAKVLNDGFLWSEDAGVHICLGSSLTVRPACDMPVSTKEKGGRLVCVNLQRTPLDNKCDVRVHAKVDEFMRALMRHLEIPIPPFELHRRVALWRDGETKVMIAGVDDDGTPQTLFENVKVNGGCELRDDHDPMTISVPAGRDLSLECAFFGHYNEANVTLPLAAAESIAAFDLAWDLHPERTFTVAKVEEPTKPVYDKGNGASRVDGVSAPVDDGTGIDYSGWFAVTPLDDCPHTSQVVFREGVTLDTKAPCVDCGNVGENMQCLSCWEVHCGRHVKQHMLAHNEATNHPIVVGFADLSFWCYECDSYINPSNPRLKLIYHLLHNSKFQAAPPTGEE